MLTPIIAAMLLQTAPTVRTIPSSPKLGTENARCRQNETDARVIIKVKGLKDKAGSVKLELYPYSDADFLQDDNKLVAAGKTFKRIVKRVPKKGDMTFCVRAPKEGTYSMMLLHDRNNDRKFNVISDGVGLPTNPTLGLEKPKVVHGRVVASKAGTKKTIVMQYLRGFGFKPIKGRGGRRR